jgi:hypothetical protein
MIAAGRTRVLVAVLVGLACQGRAPARDGLESDAAWDTRFAPPPGATPAVLPSGTNGVVHSLAAHDGKLYVGGEFTTVRDTWTLADRVACYDPETGAWSRVGGGVSGAGSSAVRSLAFDSSGRLVVGGSFQAAGGSSPGAFSSIARWDGTAWDNLSGGLTGGSESTTWVYDVLTHGSDVYATGVFGSGGGQALSSPNVAKWNAAEGWQGLGDGPAPAGAGGFYAGYGLGMAGDGTLYIAGEIDYTFFYEGASRWDGSAWYPLKDNFNHNGGGDNLFDVRTDWSGGGVLFAGQNLTYGYCETGDCWVGGGGGEAEWWNPVVQRWTDGHWDKCGVFPDYAGSDFVVRGLVSAGGQLYAGVYAGGLSPVGRLARLSGDAWQYVEPGLDGSVNALCELDGTLYAGGGFVHAGDQKVNYIAAWDGSAWQRLPPALPPLPVGDGVGMLDQTIWAMTAYAGGVCAGGYFGVVGRSGLVANAIALWNGKAWSALGQGLTDEGEHGWVDALAVTAGGDLFAAGGFTRAGTVTTRHVARWNGTAWSALDLAGGSLSVDDGSILALAAIGDDLYLGGGFTYSPTDGSPAATRIARYNAGTWTPLAGGMDHTVYALCAGGTDLYAGGYFTSAGGVTVNRVARWDGTEWHALGSGVSGGGVYCLAVHDGVVYAGGDFTAAGGQAADRIASWDGDAWSPLGHGVVRGSVWTLIPTNQGLVAGGYNCHFQAADGSLFWGIGIWNGTVWRPIGSGLSRDIGYTAKVCALLNSPQGLYVGGTFDRAGPNYSWNIALRTDLLSPEAGPPPPRVFRVDNAGNVYADGAYHTGGADFAELLPAAEGEALAPGDVLALDRDGRLVRAAIPEQTAYAGVFATRPGLLGGTTPAGAGRPDAPVRVPVAQTGIVPVKVTAANGPIEPGTPLGLSELPGFACRAVPAEIGTKAIHLPGSVIGKALEPLSTGTAAIRVRLVRP